MPSIFDKIYNESPVWIQQAGINVYGFIWKQRRYGGTYRQYVSDFLLREHNTFQEWRLYQVEALRKLLLYASRYVPYYQQLFRKCSQSNSNFTDFSMESLKSLSILTKEILRSVPEKFLSTVIKPNNLNTYYTSGTTGTPLAIKFLTDMDRLAAAAYEARVRRWARVNDKMSRAMIGGRLVVPEANAKPPFWRYNIFERQLYMSAFHISPSNAPYYAKALNSFKPDYLVGYASSHYFLARMIKEQGIEMYQPKAVLTSSEKLTDEMRSTIEEVYHCEVFDGYSGVEACCQASECEYHQMHISPDVGIIEILDENNQPVPAGQPGQIVATGLLNYAQPLIRYQTGDIGIISEEECKCGRQMPILKELVGRLEDTVIGPDGRETVRFHGIYVGLPNVKEGQIIQQTLTDFTILLVVTPEFSEEEKNVIINRFYDRLGKINLKFEFVDQIPRTKSGKFRAVISHVERKAFDANAGKT